MRRGAVVLVLSLVAGCTVVGAVGGGTIQLGRRSKNGSPEEPSVAAGIVIGALVGLAIDATIVYGVTQNRSEH